jgi:hypothetical protein
LFSARLLCCLKNLAATSNSYNLIVLLMKPSASFVNKLNSYERVGTNY